jgi:hypothetical protein
VVREGVQDTVERKRTAREARDWTRGEVGDCAELAYFEATAPVDLQLLQLLTVPWSTQVQLPCGCRHQHPVTNSHARVIYKGTIATTYHHRDRRKQLEA